MEAKRRIKKFKFDVDGAHVALVGEGANQQEVLLVKSAHSVPGQTPLYEVSENEIDTVEGKEVKITTSMQLFLKYFFNLYGEDAGNLAKILGYSSTDDWWAVEYGEDIQVELLKSAGEIGTTSEVVFDVIKSLYDKHNDIIIKKGKERMDEEIRKAVETALAAKEAEIQKAIADKDAELKKAMESIESLEKAVEAKDKEKLIEVIKGYSFVDDDKFVDVIFKMRKLEGFDTILVTLEKAQKAIDAAVEVSKGVDGEPAPKNDFDKSMKSVGDILKSRKAKGDK